MKFLPVATLCAALLAVPVWAQQETADPTADVTDTPNAEPADVPEPSDPDAPGDSCDPGHYAEFLGKPGAEVEAMKFDVPVRVIPDGAMITMDFLPDRVNFKLDADGMVAEITCG